MQATLNYIESSLFIPHGFLLGKGEERPARRRPTLQKIDPWHLDGERGSHPPQGKIISFPRQGKIVQKAEVYEPFVLKAPSVPLQLRHSRTCVGLVVISAFSTVLCHLTPEQVSKPQEVSRGVVVEATPSVALPRQDVATLKAERVEVVQEAISPQVNKRSITAESHPVVRRDASALKTTLHHHHIPSQHSEGNGSEFTLEAGSEHAVSSVQLHAGYQTVTDEDGWQTGQPKFGISAHWRSGMWGAEASYLPSSLGAADLRVYEGDTFINDASAFIRAEGKDGRFRAYGIRQETLNSEWQRDHLVGSDGTLRVSPEIQPWYKVGYSKSDVVAKSSVGSDVGVVVGKSDPGSVKFVAGHSRNLAWSDAGSTLLDSYTRSDFSRSIYAETGVTDHTYYPMQFHTWSDSVERTTAGVGLRMSTHSTAGLLYQSGTTRNSAPTAKSSNGGRTTTTAKTHGLQLVWRYTPSDKLSLDLDSNVSFGEGKGDSSVETKQLLSLKFRF